VEIVHLAQRFFGSLSRRDPPTSDTAWALEAMLPGEQALWSRMPVVDRRHAIGVARHVAASLGADATRPVLAAALLHDVGKVDSNLGTFARVLATLLNRQVGESRFARYRRHNEIGAAMLSMAGSDVLTVAWAREHHLSPDRWTLPIAVAVALKAADND
jgi:predicted HD phosphohydrolase